MSELSFWFPLFLIFASALLAAVIKRYTKDPCLKVFHRSFVFVRFRDGRWTSGDLIVYSNSLEIQFHQVIPLADGFDRLSEILYEHNLVNIERILRPSPRPGTAARQEWEREVDRLRNPSVLRLLRRRVRNLFNMLRDAFAQALVIIFGTVRRRTRFAAVTIDEAKVSEMGKSLISAVPNAYEPILEKYLGREVVVETTAEDKLIEQTGVLQEYSATYILVRDADLLRELPPPTSPDLFDNQCDVVFPRQSNSVRSLARRKGGLGRP